MLDQSTSVLNTNPIDPCAPFIYKHIDELLPSLGSVLPHLESLIKSDVLINPNLDNYENLINSWAEVRRLMSQTEAEINLIMPDEWEYENQVDNGLVCSHILATMVMCSVNDDFKQIDKHDQSVVLWSALLHDIAKRGPPEIETKDPFHPFTSASKALRVLNNLGWIPHPEVVEDTISFINNSHFYHKWADFMDNRRLPEIFQRLWYATGIIDSPSQVIENYYSHTKSMTKAQLFLYEIVAVVLLHQSFDMDPKFKNFTPLSSREIAKFTSPRLVKLLALLEKGDNGSYNLRYPQKSWTFEQRIDVETEKFLKFFNLNRIY